MNRTLTQWAARAGNGVEVICGIDEDAERVAERLLARTTAPIVTELTIEGAALRASAPARLPDLYAGSPSLVSLALAPEGGTLTLRGRTAEGEYAHRVEVPAIALGAGLASITTLFGRERVEDLETQAAAGQDADREIERVGLAFQIATRMTSWIAVSADVTVDPEAEKRAVRQPHEVPHGVSIEGLGLRAAAPMAMAAMPQAMTTTGMAFAAVPAPAARPAAYAPPPHAAPARPVAPRSAATPPAPAEAAREALPMSASTDVEDLPLLSPSEVAGGVMEQKQEVTGSVRDRYAERAIDLMMKAEIKRTKLRRWIAVLIVLFVLVTLAIGAWLAFSSGSHGEEPREPARTTRQLSRE